MRAAEYVINAALGSRLFKDDDDRRAFLRFARSIVGKALLAYCLMDSHAHLVVEGLHGRTLRRIGRLRSAYATWYRRRHGTGLEWRGETRVHAVSSATELAAKITYVHRNPLKAVPPMVEIAAEWPWSSLREYLGLSLAAIANVERGRELLGERAPEPYVHADFPGQALALDDAIAATAQMYGISPADVTSPDARKAPARAARRTFVHLAVARGYSRAAIARFLGRARARVTQLLKGTPRTAALQAAATLALDPRFRRRLPALKRPAATDILATSP